jgi:signal transduction histidine kinase
MKSSYFSLFIVLLYCFLSCRRGGADESESRNNALNDSIVGWIEKSQNDLVNDSIKHSLLLKARKKIEYLNSDSLKGSRFSDLSLSYYKMRDSINFLKSNNKVILYAIASNDSIRLAEGYWDRGAYFDWPTSLNRDSAFFYLTRAQKIYSKIGDNYNSARVFKSIATIQTKIHDNTGAIVSLIKSLELLKPLKDNRKLFEAYNTLGIAAAALNEYEEALEYYKMAEDYLSKIKANQIDKARLSNNTGLLHFVAKEFVNAKIEYQNALLNDSLFLVSPASFARVIDNLAMTNLALGDVSTVEQDLLRSFKIRDSIKDLEGISRSYYHLSEYYQTTGQKNKAYDYAIKARDLSKEINNNLRYLETLKLLAELDTLNAFKHNNEYIILSDSLLQEERRIRNKFERIRFETDETLAKNQALSRQNFIWIGIAFGVFLFGIALMIIVLQRIKNQRLRFQQQQQEANQEIFNLMLSQKQKVEEGKQSEQKRISEELHDGILGEMNGIRMVLLGLNNKKDEAAIAFREQAIEKLKDVQEEIRTISHELNNASYQKFHNFINSIEDLLKSICEPAKLDYQLTYDHDMDWDNLQGITKINLYRIFQESLQNCVKHAQASNLYVSLETNEKNMVITIQDNGRGFDTVKSKKGIGHRNIKSRMNKIKGRWYLKSAPGVGTTLVLEIPLEHISQEAKKGISLPKDLLEV